METIRLDVNADHPEEALKQLLAITGSINLTFKYNNALVTMELSCANEKDGSKSLLFTPIEEKQQEEEEDDKHSDEASTDSEDEDSVIGQKQRTKKNKSNRNKRRKLE